MLDLASIPNLFVQMAPDLPATVWWLPLAALSVLALTAAIDAVTSTVPDALIFFGLFLVTATEGFAVSWNFAAGHLALALFAAILIWGLNQGWRMLLRRDAIGMGDAKWTMLAVACFGLMPALMAWGAGACLAVLWIGAARAVKRPAAHVHFAPFLFAGLLAGLWWLRSV